MYHLNLTVKQYAGATVYQASLREVSEDGSSRIVRTYTSSEPGLSQGLFQPTQDEFLTVVLARLAGIQEHFRNTAQ